MDAGNRRRARNGNLVVRADIPGIKPEEVKIEVEDARLRFRSCPNSGACGMTRLAAALAQYGESEHSCWDVGEAGAGKRAWGGPVPGR